jgi:adenylate cyclase
MRARTGINSGRMLVGNLGSQYRFAYGALGDNVNLGSRLEGLNKEYGTEILIGENTVRLVGNAFHLREVDLVRVVGRNEPTRVYELLGASETPLSAEQEDWLERYASALAAYRERQWSAAIARFEVISAIAPNDGAALTMLMRCRHYQSSPPPDDWNGVYDLTQK